MIRRVSFILHERIDKGLILKALGEIGKLDELAKSFARFNVTPVLWILLLENSQVEQRESSYRMRQSGPYVHGGPPGSGEGTKHSRLDAGGCRPSLASIVPRNDGVPGSARIPSYQAPSVEIKLTHYRSCTRL